MVVYLVVGEYLVVEEFQVEVEFLVGEESQEPSVHLEEVV